MNHHNCNLILASQSPRRRELLENAGYSFVVMAPHDGVERQASNGLVPEELVVESAYLKARYIADRLVADRLVADRVSTESGEQAIRLGDKNLSDRNASDDGRSADNDQIVLAADTVAVCDSEIHGKPKSREDAARMLAAMSGKTHAVLTGICLWHCRSYRFKTYLESTTLVMDAFPEEALEDYLDSGQWKGKAGAFGYQDGLDWIHIESGLESNVVGLPVERLDGWISELLGDE